MISRNPRYNEQNPVGQTYIISPDKAFVYSVYSIRYFPSDINLGIGCVYWVTVYVLLAMADVVRKQKQAAMMALLTVKSYTVKFR